MEEQARVGIADHFSNLRDPRMERTKRHKLLDILVIAICGAVCGVDDWVSMEEFGRAKHDWLKGFLELPNGIPSHDTFTRVFARIDPVQFQQSFLSWVETIAKMLPGDIVAIDGKTLRQSYDRSSDKAAIHMVSAWAVGNGIVLGQVKTSEKSNEITAIPKLLEVLELEGCIVTIDAMGCQRDIAAKIIDKKADYVLSLKGNQGNLHDNIALFFDYAATNDFSGIDYDYYEASDGGHGRVEVRRHWTVSDLDWLDGKDRWKDLTTIVMVERERHIKDEISKETTYYISSMGRDAQRLAGAIRGHWGIENGLHWVLDIAFQEDGSRVRKDHGAENLAVLRHITLNLIKQEKTCKAGVKTKRLKAGWDNRYLEKILDVKPF